MMKDENQSPKPAARITSVTREDFELACIQEFSHSGLRLGTGVPRDERRERIRASILREDKAHLRWRHTGLTYAHVFAQAYQQPLSESAMPAEHGPRRRAADRFIGMDEDFSDDAELPEDEEAF